MPARKGQSLYTCFDHCARDQFRMPNPVQMGNLPPHKLQTPCCMVFDAKRGLMFPNDRAYSEVPPEHFRQGELMGVNDLSLCYVGNLVSSVHQPRAQQHIFVCSDRGRKSPNLLKAVSTNG
jgi:hypothetical protein